MIINPRHKKVAVIRRPRCHNGLTKRRVYRRYWLHAADAAVIIWSYPAYLEATKRGRRIEFFGFLAALVVAVTSVAAFIWQNAQSDRLAAIESRWTD